MPLYKIGEKFDVSGKTVKKYCTKWGIKIPAHGSWIKKKVSLRREFPRKINIFSLLNPRPLPVWFNFFEYQGNALPPKPRRQGLLGIYI